MKPEISIIVPVYNVEQYLEDCLDSILEQTFSNFEVILVNDGSSDKSGEICDYYAQNDNRIKVIHQNYGGVSSARNVGIKDAKGEFIGFIDGDDRIDKDMYKNLLTLCKEYQSEIAVCKLGREIDGQLINGDECEFIKVLDNIEGMRELFKGKLYRFSLCNKLFKKGCFEDVIFPEGRIHEDLATTYKLFSKAKKVIFKNYIGYIYVKRNHSILTSKYSLKRLDSFLAWSEILKFINKKYPQIYSASITTFTYWCVDHLNYIFQQVDNKQAKYYYLKNIKKSVLAFQEEIVRNRNVPIKYRYELYILTKSISLYLLFNNMKKIARRG